MSIEIVPHKINFEPVTIGNPIPLEAVYADFVMLIKSAVDSVTLAECGIGSELSQRLAILSPDTTGDEMLMTHIPDHLRQPVQVQSYDANGAAFVLVTPNRPTSHANFGLFKYASLEHGNGTLVWGPSGITKAVLDETNKTASSIYEVTGNKDFDPDNVDGRDLPRLPEDISEEFIEYAYGTIPSSRIDLSRKVLRSVLRVGLESMIPSPGQSFGAKVEDSDIMRQDEIGTSAIGWLNEYLISFVKNVYASREMAQSGLTMNLRGATSNEKGNGRFIWLVKNGEDCTPGTIDCALGTVGQSTTLLTPQTIIHTAFSKGPETVDSVYSGLPSLPSRIITPNNHTSEAIATNHRLKADGKFTDDPTYSSDSVSWRPIDFLRPEQGIPDLRYRQAISGLSPRAIEPVEDIPVLK